MPASHDHDDPSVPSSTPTRFATDTAVERIGPGHYRARMDPSWWIVSGPNGGYVAAVLLRAVVAEVDDPSRHPRSVTLQYLRAPVEGAVEFQVEVERSGRTVTNVSARMVQGDRTVVLALAALATDRQSPVAFDEGPGLPRMPDGSPVPMPEQVPVIDVDPDRDVPMRRHYELRWVLGDLPFRPAPDRERRARSGGWLRPAEPEPIDEVVLVAMADAWVPPVFSRVDTPMGVPTVDLTVHFRTRPADPFDPLFVVFDSPFAEHGYMVEHGRLLDRTGRLIAESRQLAVLA